MPGWISGIFPLRGWRAALLTLLTQFLSSYLVNILSYGALRRLYGLFRPWRWEDGGQIYQKVFRIRIWKDYIPAVGTFDKKQLAANPDTAYVSRYLLESLRAELCHLIALLSGIAIMAFSSWDSGRRILAWEIAVNVPCIMIQRFNRPRLERLLRRNGSGIKEFWKG